MLASIDYENHAAVVALDPATGRALGEAHLVRDSADPDVAEVAFGVVDAWQGRRLGTCLADRLARRARELGVGRLRATVYAENRRAKALLRGQGSVIDTRFEGASIELLMALSLVSLLLLPLVAVSAVLKLATMMLRVTFAPAPLLAPRRYRSSKPSPNSAALTPMTPRGPSPSTGARQLSPT